MQILLNFIQFFHRIVLKLIKYLNQHIILLLDISDDNNNDDSKIFSLDHCYEMDFIPNIIAFDKASFYDLRLLIIQSKLKMLQNASN